MIGKMVVRGILKVFLISCILAMLPSAWVHAASLPGVEQLPGITMSKSVLWSPGKLAVASDGTLYVVDSYKNHILRFDVNGNYIGDISFPRISAIAVAPNGTLYIGSHLDYSVSIVKNGKVVGQLGAGANEFRSIRDIAYDAAMGHVYVADNVGNTVRIFDESGRSLNMIEGVNLPIAIEVTPDAIYIIDAPIVKDADTITTASRISIFDRNYRLIGSIHDYGKSEIFRPTDITVHDGILYVTDAVTNTVVLFDETNILLGEIRSINSAISTAVALAVSSDGRLYVASSENQTIYLFAVTSNSGAGMGPGLSGN